MKQINSWVNDANSSLLTDLYQLTMLQAYWELGMEQESVFSLFVRRLPENRNYLVAAGLEDVLRFLESICFDQEALESLRALQLFSDDFISWLGAFRFTGDVYAMKEGTPFFQNEPVLEVVAPLPQAQLVETFIMNQIHFQTLAATKAARVIYAAHGKTVLDFGLRRMHGADAGMKAARAFYIAGVGATSNVLAGCEYGIPVAGTMAHSFVQAHDDEMEALRNFTKVHPQTILLVDTYNPLEGVKKVIALAQEMGREFQVRGIRLDSGDLAQLAWESRKLLDEAGLESLRIFVSGNLDEYSLEDISRADAPIDGLGVGTRMGVSMDCPTVDFVYKMAAYDGKGRIKTSPGKETYPGQKQVFRLEENGKAAFDILGQWGEEISGRPLLRLVMEKGRRLAPGDLEESRAHCTDALSRLPEQILSNEPARPGYEVRISPKLEQARRECVRQYAGRLT